LGLRSSEAMFQSREGTRPRIGPAAYTGPSRGRLFWATPDERVIACATRRLRVGTAISTSFSAALDDPQWRSMMARDPSEPSTPDDEVGESQNHRAADSTGRPAEGQPSSWHISYLLYGYCRADRRTYVR